jgi:hypothetical protein
MLHPFDGFWDLTRERRGSVSAANFIVFMVLAVRLFSLKQTSFMFLQVYWPRVNIFQQCLAVLLPLGVFCVGNWALTSLFEGKGTLRDVYIATSYALAPYVLFSLPAILLSNFITVDEGVIYSILSFIAVLYPALLIICAMMQIHDYTLGKTLLFTLMSVFAMLVIIFIALVCMNLVSDGIAYFISLYREIVFRLY